MYCSECGTKSKEEDIYCSECGNKLEKKNSKKQFHLNIKNISRKTKIIVGITALIVCSLIIFFSIMSSITSPKVVANHYFEGLASKNTDIIYQNLELDDDKTFVSKKILKELLASDNSYEIEEFKFTKISYGENKNSAVATFVYKIKGSSSSKTARIPLVKNGKKFLFFDNWKVDISLSEEFTINNYQIIVPKDSKVTYAGIEISDEYLKSTDNNDIYTLNQVFMLLTKIEIELSNGYKIEDNITPNPYKKSYIANISLDKINKEEQEKIVEIIKKDIDIFYQGAIKNQAFDEIKDSLNYLKEEEESIKAIYIDLKERLEKGSNILTAIDFTNITLSNVELTQDGNLNFKVKVNYNYTVKYNTLFGEESTKDSSSYNYMNFVYSINNGTYNLVGANNLKDYFSRY